MSDVRIKMARAEPEWGLEIVWNDGSSDRFDLTNAFYTRDHRCLLAGADGAVAQPNVSDDGSDLRWPGGFVLSARALAEWSLANRKQPEVYVGGGDPANRPAVKLHHAYREQIVQEPRGPWSDPTPTFLDKDKARSLLEQAVALEARFADELYRNFDEPEAARLLIVGDEAALRAAFEIFWRYANLYQNYYAASEVGKMLLTGAGVPRDPIAGRHWLEMAAYPYRTQSIDVVAKVWLAELYLAGKGGLQRSQATARALYDDIDRNYGLGLAMYIAQARMRVLWPEDAFDSWDRKGEYERQAQRIVDLVVNGVAGIPE